jgi:hypothetical protein
VLGELIARELESKAVELVYVNALPVTGRLYESLCQAASGFPVLRMPAEPHYRLELAGSFDEFLARRGQKIRRNTKNCINGLAAKLPAARLQIYTAEGELQQFIRAAELVAARTYQRQLHVGFQATQQHAQELGLAARRGWFRSYILFDWQRPAAFLEGLLCGRTYYAISTGFDPDYRQVRAGTGIFIKMWQDLCDGRLAKVCDLGVGESDYKRWYADLIDWEAQLVAGSRTFRGYRAIILLRVMQALDRMVKRLLSGLRVYGKAKTLWRRAMIKSGRQRVETNEKDAS